MARDAAALRGRDMLSAGGAFRRPFRHRDGVVYSWRSHVLFLPAGALDDAQHDPLWVGSGSFVGTD